MGSWYWELELEYLCAKETLIVFSSEFIYVNLFYVEAEVGDILHQFISRWDMEIYEDENTKTRKTQLQFASRFYWNVARYDGVQAKQKQWYPY